MYQHNVNDNLVDLMCDERETTHQVCPCCEQLRPLNSFWYFLGKQKQQSKICSNCFRELRQMDKYLAKVLDGVFIPNYEKPITKYPIICCPSSQT